MNTRTKFYGLGMLLCASLFLILLPLYAAGEAGEPGFFTSASQINSWHNRTHLSFVKDSSYESVLTIHNTGTAEAHIDARFRLWGEGDIFSIPITVSMNTVQLLSSNDLNVPNGLYIVYLVADQPIDTLVGRTNGSSVGDNFAIEEGIGEISNSFDLTPILKTSNLNTAIALFNPTPTDASVQIDIYNLDGDIVVNRSVSLSIGDAFIYNLGTEPNLPSGFIGWAHISSNTHLGSELLYGDHVSNGWTYRLSPTNGGNAACAPACV